LTLLVSIIIPVHNAAATIGETISSCLAQNHTEIELILVENGSSDGSWQMISSYEDERIQAFQLQEGNAAAARNFGFEQSKGDFVKFLDADDLLNPDHIALQISALKRHAGKLASASWVKFDNNLNENEVQPQQVWLVRKPVDWLLSSWNGGGMMVPGCWLIPRPIIQKAGLWNTSLSLHDDGEFMCRVLLSSQGNVFVKEAILYYRQSTNSLSRQKQSEVAAQSALKVCQLYEKAMMSMDDTQVVKKALARNYARFLYEYYPSYSHLCEEAFKSLSRLTGSNRFKVGGRQFNLFERVLGFNLALKMKSLLSHLKS